MATPKGPKTPGKRIGSIAGRGLKNLKSVTKREIKSVMGEALEKRKEVVEAQHKTLKTAFKKHVAKRTAAKTVKRAQKRSAKR
jgi:hypothetical protein